MPSRGSYSACPRCGTVLVSTLVFPRCEWLCLGCGWVGGMFDAPTVPATPAMHRAYSALQAEWERWEGGFLVPRSHVRGCALCEATPRPMDHPSHATDEERARDASARRWLAERVRAARCWR